MLIDWFTVIAQVINFLILVWLMKRFLYKPILLAINTREKRIAAELADADKKRTEAKKEREEFKKKNTDFDKQRTMLMKKTTDEVNIERQRLLGEAEKEAGSFSTKREVALINEANNLNQEIRRRTQSEVFAIARKVLNDLASASLEERISDVFICRLREMDKKRKESFGAALKSSQGPVVISCSFDLGLTQRKAIQNALNETFAAEIHINFKTTPDLVSGIELTMNGQKLAWSIADYLTSLEKSIDQLLKERSKAETKSEIKIEASSEVGTL